MSEDEQKVTRRLFLRHSAMVSAMSAAAYGIALKTDAMAQAEQQQPETLKDDLEDILPYVYTEFPT